MYFEQNKTMFRPIKQLIVLFNAIFIDIYTKSWYILVCNTHVELLPIKFITSSCPMADAGQIEQFHKLFKTSYAVSFHPTWGVAFLIRSFFGNKLTYFAKTQPVTPNNRFSTWFDPCLVIESMHAVSHRVLCECFTHNVLSTMRNIWQQLSGYTSSVREMLVCESC